MKILMLSLRFPYPATRGGTQIRTFNCLEALRSHHEVTLLTLREDDVTDDQIAALGGCVSELVLFDPPRNAAQGLTGKIQRIKDYVHEGTPPNVQFYYSEEIQRWIDGAVAEGRFDVLTCEHSVNALYVRPEWKDQIRTVINVHSSDYCTKYNNLELGLSENALRDRLTLSLLRRYEQQTYQKFSAIAVTTDADQAQVEALAQRKAQIIPNGVDLKEFTYRSGDAASRQLIFTGTFDYSINIDTARHLALDIFPQVQARYPDVSLAIVGSHPAPSVQELAQHPGIIVTGRVPSLATSLHESALFVAPMRAGFGIKNKTLEAMAAGIPVVGSDRALEGLCVDPASACGGLLPTPLRALRANRPEDCIAAIIRLFEDADLRRTLRHNARAYMEDAFTWERLGKRYRDLVVGKTAAVK